MARTPVIRVRNKTGQKHEAEDAFEETGLLVSEACGLFRQEAVAPCRPSFAERIPNKETRAAIRRVRARKGLIRYDSLEDFRKDMDLMRVRLCHPR